MTLQFALARKPNLFENLSDQADNIDFESLGPNSQNFFSQICKIFVTLGLKILGFLRLKVFFKQITLKLDVI